MKLNELVTDCVLTELSGDEVVIREDCVVALINPFELVKQLERIKFDGVLLRAEWICPSEEAEQYTQEMIEAEIGQSEYKREMEV